ncbi:MAG: DUF4411 family protein [Deltaproteobacteria bacterium]|nr:DUF4411 family protein [Deltaproteobacteria bacterium]
MYVIDTSALLDGWVRYYPLDVFSSLWSNIEGMIKTGDLLAPDEVLSELSQKDDTIYRWARANSTMFVPLASPFLAFKARHQFHSRSEQKNRRFLGLLLSPNFNVGTEVTWGDK